MPAKKDAQWWADYRARKKDEADAAKAKEIVKDTGPLFEAARKEVRDTRVARVEPVVVVAEEVPQKASRYRMLPGDDWVSKMTQHERDAILNHPAIKTSKRA